MDKKKLQEAEEQIKTALLYMNYDSSKTLNENKEKINVIKEDNSQCPNSMTGEDIRDKAEKVSNTIKLMNAVFFKLGYQDERAKEIYEIILELSNHNFYDITNKTCQNSLKRFEQEFQVSSQGVFYEKGGTFEEKIRETIDYVKTKSVNATNYLIAARKIFRENKDNVKVTTDEENTTEWNKYPCVPSYPGAKKTNISTGGVAYLINGEYYYANGRKKTSDGKMVNFTCDDPLFKENSGGGGGGTTYKPCTGTYTQNCKSEKIREVQRCLGMPPKYQTGNFGPITFEYLERQGKGFQNGFTDADVSKICGNTLAGGGGNRNPYKDWQSEEPETGETSTSNVEG